MSDDMELMDSPGRELQPVEAAEDDGADRDSIEEPGKLLRIALMLREMQEEVRRTATDEAGRDRLQLPTRRVPQLHVIAPMATLPAPRARARHRPALQD